MPCSPLSLLNLEGRRKIIRKLMMAALRNTSLVPVRLIKHGLFSPVVRRARANTFSSLVQRCQPTFSYLSFTNHISSKFYSTTKATTDAKGLAEEILKSRLQADGGGGKEQKDEQKQETEEEKKKREAAWRTMKYTFIAFGVTFTSLGIWVLVECGAPLKDPDGNDIEDEYSGMPVVQQYIARSWRELVSYRKMIQEPSRDKLLPDPLTEPYYQPPYTLVLEMTDVLVHPDWTYQTGWRFKKRPGVDFFLTQVAPPLFEVVIYTAEQGFTAFPILDALDPHGCISYRLFRDATKYVDGHHIKDLESLNRDLSKVIVVDWNDKSIKENYSNALLLPRWKGNDDDQTLIELAVFLKTIATSEVQDVREVLNYYHQFDDPLEAFKENLQKLQAQEVAKQQQLSEEKKKSPLANTFLKRR
ncbi:mitochondrial import inner membrane translocase subunit TIM50-C-like [Neocloeon triangulifer]|uniref:mitochondrial import inner membrane translocase subunit TIM50-C-like n=1 Tax=Neocloeon triangulifer TaxID=2078957 RepID=UPI00286F5893|nr:mitochondrial import inner membrane translocase subunit TIM50-C-like [Neocloeon triangulifer]